MSSARSFARHEVSAATGVSAHDQRQNLFNTDRVDGHRRQRNSNTFGQVTRFPDANVSVAARIRVLNANRLPHQHARVLSRPRPRRREAGPTFRSRVQSHLVDVTVREAKGSQSRTSSHRLRGSRERQAQAIVTFAEEHVVAPAETIVSASTLSRLVTRRGGVPVRVTTTPSRGAAQIQSRAGAAGPHAAVDASRGRDVG